jgi:hypothetical protein
MLKQCQSAADVTVTDHPLSGRSKVHMVHYLMQASHMFTDFNEEWKQASQLVNLETYVKTLSSNVFYLI